MLIDLDGLWKFIFYMIKQGVTIPSQRRYIEYFSDFVQNKRVLKDDLVLNLKKIEIIVPEKQLENFAKVIKIKIFKDKFKKIYESSKIKINSKNDSFLFEFKEPFDIYDDIKFTFYNKKKVCLTKDLLFGQLLKNVNFGFNLRHSYSELYLIRFVLCKIMRMLHV